MFNIFRNEGEPIFESIQVRKIFRRVQHHQLSDTIKACEVRDDIDGITYLEAANHLTAAFYKTLEYQLYQKVSGVQPSGGKSGDNSGSGGPNKGGRNS